MADAELPEDDAALEALLDKLKGKFKEFARGSRDKNSARVHLAAGAILRFATESVAPRAQQSGYTIKQLFSPFADIPENKTVSDQGKTRSWQRDFVHRLLAQDLIEKQDGHTLTYYPTEGKERLTEILTDFIDGDGIQLKRLVFPHLYPDDGGEVISDDEASDDDEGNSEADAEGSEAGAISEIATQLQAVAAHLSTLFESLNALASRQGAAIERMEDQGRAQSERFGQLLDAFDKLRAEYANTDRQLLQQLVTRLTDSEARKRSLANQWEAESRRTEEASVEAAALLKRMGPAA